MLMRHNGQPLPAPLRPQRRGIGRANANPLALGDPDRTASHLYAPIACRHGLYLVIDQGCPPCKSTTSLGRRPGSRVQAR